MLTLSSAFPLSEKVRPEVLVHFLAQEAMRRSALSHGRNPFARVVTRLLDEPELVSREMDDARREALRQEVIDFIVNGSPRRQKSERTWRPLFLGIDTASKGFIATWKPRLVA